MIVGYFDHNGRAFCFACWSTRAESGPRPATVLDSEDSDEPDNNFWIVDECADCGAKVNYRELTALS